MTTTATIPALLTAIENVAATGDEATALDMAHNASVKTLRAVLLALDEPKPRTKAAAIDAIEFYVAGEYNAWQDNHADDEGAEVVELVTAEQVADALRRTDRGMHKHAAIALGAAPARDVRRMHRPALVAMLSAREDRAAVIAALATAEAEVTAKRATKARKRA
jgi:hypothetical protein